MLNELRMHLNPSSKYPELHTPSKENEKRKNESLFLNNINHILSLFYHFYCDSYLILYKKINLHISCNILSTENMKFHLNNTFLCISRFHIITSKAFLQGSQFCPNQG